MHHICVDSRRGFGVSPMGRPLLVFLSFSISLPSLPCGAAGQANYSELVAAAWERATAYNYNEAHRIFSKAIKTHHQGDTREAAFGQALMLLNYQPKTVGNIKRAGEVFESLAGAAATDDIAVLSLYFIGRIYQVHQRETDFARAAEYFLEAIERAPRHRFGQLAVARLATVWLYEPVSRNEKRSRFHRLRGIGDGLTYEPARRDFNYVMGVACLCFDLSKEYAIEHLREVEAAGLHQRRSIASIYSRIGETARQLGDIKTAEEYFAKFLAEFPREERTRLIRERLANLKQ